ncbi:MAG: nuclear transport factor 2 family protein [Candidatus Eremiobacterota bacterium]
MTLLQTYVQLHNLGVEAGDFHDLLALFSDEAVLEFRGIPLGPFRGRPAIARAFAERPPDDQLVLLDGEGSYAWLREPGRRAGRIRLDGSDMIVRLVIIREGA